MLGICLGLAGHLWASLPAPEFTLSWQHTVEKIRWEEDYQVTDAGLLLMRARVKGTGAGMEIPEGAVFIHDSWQYQPHLPPLPLLRLGRTPEGGDYQLCQGGQCRPMADWIGPPDKAVAAVELWPCESPAALLP